ncbi:hypothetical protein B0J11DRAFT_537845 [Dendryphion nanum]|uniref:Uncharacterized protein n=1 Tax=Dendryphion nanum TaxID=256645 RepID=A0A9P9DAQ2_9PLEO|nr:hypothetical protein B0J11DRAFT_537845 [Dendryphion nanum]
METLADLLNLPPYKAFQHDRNFLYDERYENPDRWRRAVFRNMLEKYHYNKIFTLQSHISILDAQIKKHCKGRNLHAQLRARPYESKRQRQVKELQELELGWAKIAIIMREGSRKLFKLPREIRDQIYGYLYTRNRPIKVTNIFVELGHAMLARDDFHFLNKNVVDPQIAKEAAGVLYRTNTFELDPSPDLRIVHFLRTDHFSSGIIPADFIRRLNLRYHPHPFWTPCDHITFERQQREKNSPPEMRLHELLGMDQLRNLKLTLVHENLGVVLELRDISPIIKIMREARISVEVFTEWESIYNDWRFPEHGIDIFDFSDFFDKPSVEDMETVQRYGNLDVQSMVAYIKEDPNVDRPMKGSHGELVAMSQWKLYFEEHYKVFNEFEVQDKIAKLRVAKGNLDAISRALV